MPHIDVRRAAQRSTARNDWLESARSFSFESDYDPENVRHGDLIAHNEDGVAAGGGYGLHPHQDLEIVTWVLEGTLMHEDSTGHRGEIRPGMAQLMSAGRGIRHSERNGGDGPVRFVQMWVLPNEPGLVPSYAQRDVTRDLAEGTLIPIASGLPHHRDTPVRLHNPRAGLHVARLGAGASVTLPDAPYLHLFVAVGSVALEGSGSIDRGDAARLTDAGARRVSANGPAEILVWEMHRP